VHGLASSHEILLWVQLGALFATIHVSAVHLLLSSQPNGCGLHTPSWASQAEGLQTSFEAGHTLFVNWQVGAPLTTTQTSSVHGFMSLQMNGFSSQVPNKGLHSTGLHKSTVVQVTPLHLAQSITGEKAHCPSETEQVSAVHALPSVHDFTG